MIVIKIGKLKFHGILSKFTTPSIGYTNGSIKYKYFIEFHGTWSASIRWHKQFHGIPWNLMSANFTEMGNFMEFHGTLSAPTSLTLGVPWNSMEHVVYQFRRHEQFHGIPRNLWVSQFRWRKQFHGIPWNFECANFADTNSTMEFHGTSLVIKNGNFEVAWILLEFV